MYSSDTIAEFRIFTFRMTAPETVSNSASTKPPYLPEKKKGHYLLNHSLPDLTEDIAVDGVDLLSEFLNIHRLTSWK